jgi:hypothetical protein
VDEEIIGIAQAKLARCNFAPYGAELQQHGSSLALFLSRTSSTSAPESKILDHLETVLGILRGLGVRLESTSCKACGATEEVVSFFAEGGIHQLCRGCKDLAESPNPRTEKSAFGSPLRAMGILGLCLVGALAWAVSWSGLDLLVERITGPDGVVRIPRLLLGLTYLILGGGVGVLVASLSKALRLQTLRERSLIVLFIAALILGEVIYVGNVFFRFTYVVPGVIETAETLQLLYQNSGYAFYTCKALAAFAALWVGLKCTPSTAVNYSEFTKRALKARQTASPCIR